MLWGAPIKFEIRSEGGTTNLRGAFPYGAETVLGNGRRERFAARAFRSRIEAGENVFLLAGHDPEKPLASTEAGSLTLRTMTTRSISRRVSRRQPHGRMTRSRRSRPVSPRGSRRASA